MRLFDYELTVVRVDRLSLVFGYIFHLAAFLAAIYALHVKDTVQHVAAMIYVGAAVGAVFAGDLITLFVYWELTAVSSVFLIWATRTEAAYRSGMRYLVIQVGSGVLLLAGVILHASATGSIAFGQLIGEDGLLSSASAGVVLIFLAFGVKAAFPFLHNWLQDAYPNGTVTGTVFLSAFTTKLAIYALARGFPGTEILIPMGVVMTLFPVVYAVIENDLRKVLAYSLNNQLGYMVVGIGIGTALSLNGTVSHAFAHILYKALLFMTMGAVLYRTGTIKATELGGLYKSMPVTTVCCLIAAASISGFPFFSGFVTKSMVISAVEHHHMTWIFVGLLVASAGVMEHSGIKIPYFAFFAHDSGHPGQGGAVEHAGGDGGGGRAVPLHRSLPGAALQHPALPGRGLRALHGGPRPDFVPAPGLRDLRLCSAGPDRHLPAREGRHQHRLRLDLPQDAAGPDSPADRGNQPLQ